MLNARVRTKPRHPISLLQGARLLVLIMFFFQRKELWRGILDKNAIGSYHKVQYIESACILSYRGPVCCYVVLGDVVL